MGVAALHDLLFIRRPNRRLFIRRVNRRQVDPHDRSLAEFGFHADPSFMFFHDAVHRRQPESAAETFGREEGFEDAPEGPFIHAHSIVPDIHADIGPGIQSRKSPGQYFRQHFVAAGDRDRARAVERLRGVGQDGLQHRLHLRRIGMGFPNFGIQIGLHEHRRTKGALDMGKARPYQIAQRNGPGLIFVASGVIQQLPRHLRHPLGRAFHRLDVPRAVRIPGPLHLEQFEIAGDHEKIIVELMGDTTGQGFHLFDPHGPGIFLPPGRGGPFGGFIQFLGAVFPNAFGVRPDRKFRHAAGSRLKAPLGVATDYRKAFHCCPPTPKILISQTLLKW